MTYFVFSQLDRGGCHIVIRDKAELEAALGPGGDYEGRQILDAMPDWDRQNFRGRGG